MVVHQGGALVGFLQNGINDDAPRDVFQFHNGHAHHERNVSGACDRQDRFGVDAARIRDDRPGRSDCNVSGSIGVKEWITSEIDREGAVRIAPEHLFKRDLIGDPCFVVTACAVREGHRTAAFQPGGDGGDPRGIRDEAGGGQDHIVVDVFTFQLRQTSRSAGYIGLCAMG